ncbi:disease resistance protein [Fagus crenata]
MKALKDDNIRAIGVYGMGGTGKTMLVGEVATQAMKDKYFEEVVTIIVLEDSILMALYDFDSSELPEKFECPQVKLIILESQWGALQIQNTFFEGVKNLKVLVLSYMCLTKLPSSLLFLDNLQTLYLIDCELEDIAMIGELKNLKVLSLSRSNIRQLPKEIEQLTDLKLLDLTEK